MNTAQTWQTKSTSSEATVELGEAIGRKLRGGEVIELVSDLGGGKTTFVRGLARGLGSHDTVSSPSFTLSNQYEAGDLTLYHLDFYRLSEPGIMRDELAELLDDPRAIVVVEWANIVENVLPAERLLITLKAESETGRQLTFQYPEKLAYLIPHKT
jgi:tRNA threonylcarbamoyladenosine biosynthesis protein TsaE